MRNSKKKNTIVGIELLRDIVSSGKRTFSIDEARSIARQKSISSSYLPQVLMHLARNGWINRIKKGLYVFSANFGIPSPHEFIIAQTLVQPSVISYWTAMHHHHLTQQTPNIIFSIVPSSSSIPRKIDKRKYRFIHQKDFSLGVEKIWIDDVQIAITDLERTLLDGLKNPNYCGDFFEVMHSFEMARDRLDIQKIISYALQLDGATIKRLGWVLEKNGFQMKEIKLLYDRQIKGYRKLDSSQPRYGQLNNKWMIQENVS